MLRKSPTSLSATALIALSLLASACTAQTTAKDRTPASVVVPEGMATAVLGAGCFWCVEVFYESLDGVQEAVSGYAGGDEVNPTYQEVAMGRTSHVEVVQVIYDPATISYRELIDFFWTTHDATRGDGVWPDFGPHYRSILLYQNEAEKSAIEASKQAYESETGKTVATDIKLLDVFYPAETYHQDYARKNPNDRYVRGVLKPKLKKLGIE
jgi:peptide-methionine (S)-S-oxide reductase